MPTTITELADDTAFERFVLERTFPLMPSSAGTASVIELGTTGSISVAATPQTAVASVSVSVSDGSRSPVEKFSVNTVRPLLFGAAWKVLDQVVELALEQAGESHDRGSTFTIKLKRARASRVPALPPLNGHAAAWNAAMVLYANTAELRNSLAHRQLVVDSSTGAIAGAPQPGQAASVAVTAEEQAAFCQVAEGVVNAIIGTSISTRQAGQLRWSLDQLVTHHGQQLFGDSPATGLVPRVIVRPPVTPAGEVTLDFAAVRTDAQYAVGDVTHYDLEIHLPDGRVVACALEDAPDATVSIRLSTLPPWLRWL